MERRSAARVAKWRNRRDTSDAHQQLRALRKLELMEEIKDRVVHGNFTLFRTIELLPTYGPTVGPLPRPKSSSNLIQ